jgi:uncharacterized protein (TIGR03000 family)
MSCKWIKERWLTTFLLGALAAATPAGAWADDGPQSAAPKGRNPAEIAMRVPDGARIWFDGEETTQTGTSRKFVSPPLDPGREYTYEVRVQWKEGEAKVERTRRLPVQAGDHIGLEFSRHGLVEVRGVSSEQLTAPAVAPARTAPLHNREPAAAPPAPAPARHFYDPGPRPGPPGSNDPLSLGVGNG